jgi:hypothetical protein
LAPLSLPAALPICAFEIDDPPRVAFAPGFDDDAARWSFQLLSLSPRHQAAVALRAPGPLRAVVRELVPFAE